jgi:hypothetical protein
MMIISYGNMQSRVATGVSKFFRPALLRAGFLFPAIKKESRKVRALQKRIARLKRDLSAIEKSKKEWMKIALEKDFRAHAEAGCYTHCNLFGENMGKKKKGGGTKRC